MAYWSVVEKKSRGNVEQVNTEADRDCIDLDKDKVQTEDTVPVEGIALIEDIVRLADDPSTVVDFADNCCNSVVQDNRRNTHLHETSVGHCSLDWPIPVKHRFAEEELPIRPVEHRQLRYPTHPVAVGAD